MTFVPGQILTASELTAAFSAKLDSGSVTSYSVTLLSGSNQSAWFSNLGLPAAAPGSANGLATLDNTGVLAAGQVPPGLSLANLFLLKGDWNASTNNPALASGVGTSGWFYVVTTAGATNIDGNNAWSIGDCIFFDGVAHVWRKINSSGNVVIPSTNISDSTAVGRNILTAATTLAQRVDLQVDSVQLVVDTDQTVTNAMQSVAWTSLSAARNCNMPSAASLNQGQLIYVYDESGNCSGINTITLNANGSDTINNLSTFVLRTPYAGAIVGRGSATKLTAMPISPDTAGFRNRIINGDMRVDQRNAGASQTFTAGAALAYSVDRWYGYCTGANVTGQQVAGSSSDRKQYQFTGAASVTAIGFAQRIEAANCVDLAGFSAVLSLELANTLLTTVTWTAYYATSTDTFGTLASPTKTSIATGTFTVTSTLTKYYTVISIPAAATTGIEIVLTVGAQISGTWTIGSVQLESGTIRTLFERLPISVELDLCQRYFWQTPGAFSPAHYITSGGIGFDSLLTFPVTMRVVPTASATFSSSTNCTPTIVATTTGWVIVRLTSSASGLLVSTYNSGNTFNSEL